MNKNRTLIIIVVISIISIIYITIYVINLYKYLDRKALAIKYTGANNYYCGEDFCPLQSDSNLTVPKFLDTLFTKGKNDDKNVLETSRFMAFLIGRLVKYYNDEYSSLIPPKVKMEILSRYTYNNNLIGILAKTSDNPDISLLYFRGTDGTGEWLQDFTISQTSRISQISKNSEIENNSQSSIELLSAQYRYINLSVKNGLQSLKNNPILIHSGFNNIYSSFKKQLMNDISKYPSDKIVIAGHSLGCALGTLAGFDIATLSKNMVYITLFSSPLVGNKSFVDTFTSLSNVAITLYNNTCDIVPELPLSVTPNFGNPERPFYYNPMPSKNTVYFSKNRLSLSNNHLIPTYIEFIEESLKKLL